MTTVYKNPRYQITYTPGREQAYTVWCDGKVVRFEPGLESAQHWVENPYGRKN